MNSKNYGFKTYGSLFESLSKTLKAESKKAKEFFSTPLYFKMKNNFIHKGFVYWCKENFENISNSEISSLYVNLKEHFFNNKAMLIHQSGSPLEILFITLPTEFNVRTKKF